MKEMMTPLINSLSEGDQRTKAMESMKENLLKKLGRPDLGNMNFTSHELKIAEDVIKAEDIKVSFADIGGMQEQKEDIFDNIILPIRHWLECYEEGRDISLVHCPTGIMMHGKPGTGDMTSFKRLAI